MRLGVLDVGSNTVHLLIVDARFGGAPTPAASQKRELRLAEHLDGDQMGRSGIDALIDTVSSAKRQAEDTGCARMLPFVTSALREAVNCDEVIDEIAERTGIQLMVLSGADESRSTFLAARRWLGWSAGTLAVLDIGGGSFELAAGPDEDPDVAISVQTGAGRMSRMFPDAGKDPDQLHAMRTHVRTAIGQEIGELLRRGPFDRAVGTSKTFRSLSRLAGAAPRSEGPFVHRELRLSDLHEWVEKLAGMKPAQREKLPGLSAGRSRQILAGAVVAEAALELGGFEVIDICPWALREGLILNYLDHIGGHDSLDLGVPLFDEAPVPR